MRQSGHATYKVDKHKESYILPFPDVYAKSVLTGSPYPELNGTYRIHSTSGLTAEINFGGKPKRLSLTGTDRNYFEASIYKTMDKTKKNLYESRGIWSDAWTVKDGKGKELYTYDLSDPKNQPAPMMMAPLDKQSPWESRRAWRDVAEPLQEGDFSKALNAKSKLENGQRDMRKREKAEGKKWDQAFFSKVDETQEKSAEGGALSKLLETLDNDEVKNILGSDGCWRFDASKAEKWREGQRSRPEAPC